MERLAAEEIGRFLASCGGATREIVHALRSTVLKTAPEVDEAIRFDALCCFRPNQAFGAIGGNVCMIECRDERVALSFIHGARLPDPEGLLIGKARAKRRVPITSVREARAPSLRRLIRAAAALSTEQEAK